MASGNCSGSIYPMNQAHYRSCYVISCWYHLNRLVRRQVIQKNWGIYYSPWVVTNILGESLLTCRTCSIPHTMHTICAICIMQTILNQYAYKLGYPPIYLTKPIESAVWIDFGSRDGRSVTLMDTCDAVLSIFCHLSCGETCALVRKISTAVFA